MRKWELITDLFDNKVGDQFPEKPKGYLWEGLIHVRIAEGGHYIDPKLYPQHFRLVEEPEFTESDMVEAMQMAWNLRAGQDTLPIIETIRKRKAGKP